MIENTLQWNYCISIEPLEIKIKELELTIVMGQTSSERYYWGLQSFREPLEFIVKSNRNKPNPIW